MSNDYDVNDHEMGELWDKMRFTGDILGKSALIDAQTIITTKWLGDPDAEWWDCQSKLNESNWDEFVEDCKNALWSAFNGDKKQRSE